ncbi:MAG: hypothetical protein R3190_00550 [Thermoanaerobaculia bacterium]|nr:hypothetical protein [Thermoanaerobaculia bacterium]
MPRFLAFAALASSLCLALAPATLGQQTDGIAVVQVTVNQPQGNGPARLVTIDQNQVDLCYNADPQQCIDAGEDVEVAWEVQGLEEDQVLRIFVKQGGGRGEARGPNGSMFRSNYAATANGRLPSGPPDAPDFSTGRSQRWRYRILVYNQSSGRVVGSLDPMIIVRNGP